MSKTFLTAQWKKLAMANFTVDPQVLTPYLPKHTELDLWNGTCYVSLVGFMFEDVRLKRIKIPLHTRFEEVNLRFYVRYNDQGEWKRGTVFIKEIVPKSAITLVANTVYGEKYETMAMNHSWVSSENELTVSYHWRKGNWNSFKVAVNNALIPIETGTIEEFITEHYWGYTKLSDNKTSEYGVEHPRWDVYQTVDYEIAVDFGNVYGTDFAFLSQEKPLSVFLAEGSKIAVKSGRKIK